MRNKQINKISAPVKTAKALAGAPRLRIVSALMYTDELCVCQVTELLKLSPSTVSRHIHVLENAGLVKFRKCGRWIYYKLSPDFPPGLKRWVKNRVVGTQKAKEDIKKLDEILSCDPVELCRKND